MHIALTSCIVLAVAAAVQAAPAPAITPACQSHVVAGARDTCQTIIKKYDVTLKNLLLWNPTLNPDCSNFQKGETICLSKPLSTSSTTSNGKRWLNRRQAAPPATTGSSSSSGPSGLTVAVVSDQSFCIMLPNSPGNMAENNGTVDPNAISRSELTAVSFCTSPGGDGLPSNSRQMPSGFITSAKYEEDTSRGIVQVTGLINRDAYNLSANDGGGQYDNHGRGSPAKSVCQGYKYYVALVEPNINDFCIRCCQSYTDCNAGRSQDGCKTVVPSPIEAPAVTTTTTQAAQPTVNDPSQGNFPPSGGDGDNWNPFG